MMYFQVLLVRYRRRKSSVPEFRYPVPQGESTGTWWVGLGKKEGVAGVAAFGFRRPKENTGGDAMDARSFHRASLGIWTFGEEGRVYLA